MNSVFPEISLYQEKGIAAARIAGEYLKKSFGKPAVVESIDARDIKLQADRYAEHLIREYLAQEAPLPIIGEEEGGDASLLDQQTPFWVVDPLDGTFNYYRKQTACCVSIGLMIGKQFEWGVIYDFNRDELFEGGRAYGARCNGIELTPRWAKNLNESCLITGFPSLSEFNSAQLERFIQQLKRFKKVRMIGSAALELVAVATGAADVYFEENTRLWDVAAGIAITEGAGGHIQAIQKPEKKLFLFDICAVGNKDWFVF